MTTSVASGSTEIIPDKLFQAYLSAGGHLVSVQGYAQLIQTQATLDVSFVDAGLGELIGAFQGQTQKNAAFVSSGITPKLITMIADGSNACALMAAVVIDVREPALAAASFFALSDVATNIHSDAQALSDTVATTQSAIKSVQGRYTTALDKAIQELGNDAKTTSDLIASLNTEIQKNIDDIVNGSVAVGAAVSELAIGVLTILEPEEAAEGEGGKPKDGKPKDEKPKDEEPKSTAFVAHAIAAGRGGASQFSQAKADLLSNDQKLAAAYQQLATFNSLLAIAKVIEAQSLLFITAMDAFVVDVQTLLQSWLNISTDFESFANSLKAGGDASGIPRQVSTAQHAWASLNTELNLVKAGIINQGGLPVI